MRAQVSSGLSYIYNFPGLDPSLVLYYPLDTSANGPKVANYATGLPVYDASLVGSSTFTYRPGTFITGLGDLSLNNTMGSQLVANTAGNNYVVCNNTVALNISGGFSISLWFACNGQLNKTGTLLSLPLNTTGNGFEIDVSGTNMIYSGYYVPYISIVGGDFQASTGGYTYVVCKSSTTLTLSNAANSTVSYLVIGGGGGGGGTYGGGGGAGGVVNGTLTYPSSSGTLSITVGTGGTGYIDAGTGTAATNGNSSSVSGTGITTVTAAGGGSGGGYYELGTGYYTPNSGASGGGGSATQTGASSTGGGFAGGNGGSAFTGGGGGGGSAAVGGNAVGAKGGVGGIGTNAYNTWMTAINSYSGTGTMDSTFKSATSTGYIAGGGAGGSNSNAAGYTLPLGGLGGGGIGGGNYPSNSYYIPGAGVVNTGSGGGSSGGNYPGANAGLYGGNGGKGLVILRIPTSSTITTTGPLDSLSSAAKTAMFYSGTRLSAGAFGVLKLYSGYTGPTIQIKAGTGGTPTDFYPVDSLGNLATIGGQTLTSFLSGATAYVTKWYDQTGNGNHTTGVITGTNNPPTFADSNQNSANFPIFDNTKKCLDFSQGNAAFKLANGAFPSGNSSYTYTYRIGTTYTAPSGGGGALIITFSCGTYNTANNTNLMVLFNPVNNQVLDSWYSLNIYPANSSSAKCIYSHKYDSSAPLRTLYYNKNSVGTRADGNHGQANTNNCIGYCTADMLGQTHSYFNSQMPFFYWAPIALTDSDRNILENTTIFY